MDIHVEFNTAKSAVFTDYLDEGTPLISNQPRNIAAYTFRTMPVEKFNGATLKI